MKSPCSTHPLSQNPQRSSRERLGTAESDDNVDVVIVAVRCIWYFKRKFYLSKSLHSPLPYAVLAHHSLVVFHFVEGLEGLRPRPRLGTDSFFVITHVCCDRGLVCGSSISGQTRFGQRLLNTIQNDGAKFPTFATVNNENDKMHCYLYRCFVSRFMTGTAAR